jgi:hypothetical protein
VIVTDVTRILSAWARHPVHGVAAQMSFVGRARMSGGTDPKAPVPTIYDDIDSLGGDEPDMALEIDPPKVPALVIFGWSGGEFNLNDVNYLRTGEDIIVAFAYVTRDTPAKKAKLDGGQTLRAVRRCLYRYKMAAKADRELNGVTVLKIGRSVSDIVAGGAGRSKMYGLLAAHVTAVDTDP